jgi:hypothetical protein
VISEERETKGSKPTAIKDNTMIDPTLNSTDHQLLRQNTEPENSLSEQFQKLQMTDNNSHTKSLIASSPVAISSVLGPPANLTQPKATSLPFGDTTRQPDAVLS